MAAELTTTKLNADSHLLLDQPLLRLPHELVRRNFKMSQRYVEREKDYILPTLKDTANASLSSTQTPDQTLASLDAMIARMLTLKRKLQILQEEEDTIHTHSAKRIRHLQDLYDIPSLADVKYEEWSRTRLDRLMVDYLLRSGYSATAASLAREKQITDLVDLDVFISCHKIADSLLHGDTKDALSWCNENRAALKKIPDAQLPHKQNLEFELRLQQYIELVRVGTPAKKIEAIQHSQKFLLPHSSTRSECIMNAAALLSYSPEDIQHNISADDIIHDKSRTTNVLPTLYATLFSPNRWRVLSQLFIKTHHILLTLPTRPLLHVALSAGLSALKTPACHSQFNPTSSSTPGHARLATGTSLCPICSTELNELARNVPYAHHTKSYVENDPVVLPNGWIYGRKRLEDLQRKLAGGLGEVSEGEVRDPNSREVFQWEDVTKVFIS